LTGSWRRLNRSSGKSGKLEALANRWETVKRVNFAFRSALEDGSKAEDFRDLLQELGGNRVAHGKPMAITA
jgi:hypothetical protein